MSNLPPPGPTSAGGGDGSNPFADDLHPDSIPPSHRKEGTDWLLLSNPHLPRPTMDVTLVHTLMHDSVVCCVRFSLDGKYLATGCNKSAQVFDVKTGLKTHTLIDEEAGKQGDLYIRSVSFSPDGKCLATGADDKQIRIWDLQSQRIHNVFAGHQKEIYSLDFSLDGRKIASGSADRSTRIWDMMDGSCLVLIDELNSPIMGPSPNDPGSSAPPPNAGVTSVSISSDNRFVAAGSLDSVIRIWDIHTGKLVERLREHRDSVYSVTFTPDGRGLVAGSLDKTLKYWDVSALMSMSQDAIEKFSPGNAGNKELLNKSHCTLTFTGHKDYVLSASTSHDASLIVSGSKDQYVHFWDAQSAAVQCMLQGHKNSVISTDLSPSGNVLATGSGDRQARIWTYVPLPQD